MYYLIYYIVSNVHYLVEISGIEPLTYAVQVRRSPKLSYIPVSYGAFEWTRTTDLTLIRRVL